MGNQDLCVDFQTWKSVTFGPKLLNGPTCLERQEALEDVVDKVHVSAFNKKTEHAETVHTATCQKKKG